MMSRSKQLSILAVIGAVVVLAGCGPKTQIAEESKSACTPKDLQVDPSNQSLDIYWQDNCTGLKSGYNIYISDTSLVAKYPDGNFPASVRPFNLGPYPGDTNPDDPYQHFIAERLQNGKKYYVSVRVVNADQTMSRPSNEVLAIPGPHGDIELAVRYKNGDDGYSFEKDQYVKADATDNDLYYYTVDGKDYLASPERLNGFLKKNRLQMLNLKGDFAAIREKITGVKPNATLDKIVVNARDWLLIRLVNNSYALVQVKGFEGTGDQRKVKLYFAYDPAPGELIF